MSVCVTHDYVGGNGEPPCPEPKCPNGHDRDVFISIHVAKLGDGGEITFGDERTWIRQTFREPGYRGAIKYRWQQVKAVE